MENKVEQTRRCTDLERCAEDVEPDKGHLVRALATDLARRVSLLTLSVIG